MKKFLSLILTIALVLSFAPLSFAEEKEPVQIGFIGWGYTDGLGASYKRYLDYLAPYCGWEISYGQYTNAEDIIGEAENLIQKGCDVIMTTIASASLIQLCEKNGVYLAQWGSPVNDAELKVTLEKSPYWVGCSTVDDYGSGRAMVEALYAEGCRSLMALAPAAGNSCHDLRWSGIMDAVAEHEDMQIVAEFRNAQLSTNAPSAIQNAIAMFPEMDGIAVTGASSGTLEAVIQTLDTEGMIGTIRHATLDIQPDTDAYLDEGSLTFIGGGQYPEVAFLAICCVNAYDGAIELPVQIDSQFINVIGSEGYQDYITYIDAEGVYPWSGEEMQRFVARYNPEATFQDLYDAWKGYSMESVKARKGA